MKGRVLGITAVVLSCFGAFIAGTLSLAESRGSVAPCGGFAGCATVAESAYSRFLGYPVAFYGLAGYVLLLVLNVWSSVSLRALRLALAVSGFGAAISFLLIAVSVFRIHATCLWCLASAATMASLLGITPLRLRAPATVPLKFQSALAACLLGMSWFGAARVAAHAEHSILNAAALNEIPFAELAPTQCPSLGDRDAPITVIEFADFACPACRDIEGRLRKLLADTAGVRLVFRNLPQPFLGGHEASGYGAVCGEIANENGKFWSFAEQAFATPVPPKKADYEGILKGLSIDAPVERRAADLQDPAVLRIDRDVSLSRRLGVAVTPVFVVCSPELPPQFGSNLNLSDILRLPKIISYLRHRSR